MKEIIIQNRVIGEGKPTFIIAEIGMSHDGNLEKAKRFIEAAADSGADAVKFQAHIAEAETLQNAPPPPYFSSEPRFSYFKRTAFDRIQLAELKSYAEDRKVVFLCSPFSVAAVDLLESIDVPAYKIPSGENTNLPMLEYIAKKGKPVIISSGMSTIAELEEAISLMRLYNRDIILLQCTSEYPCGYERVGLNLLGEFRQKFGLPVGLSDHTLTIYMPIAAVSLGACVIEKHFTLSRDLYGPDARFSLPPEDFRSMVDGIRAVETALANPVNKDDIVRLGEMKRIFQKSIVSSVKIKQGAVIREEMLDIKKPGEGLPPKCLPEIIGKKARRTILRDSLIHREGNPTMMSHRKQSPDSHIAAVLPVWQVSAEKYISDNKNRHQ
ncbi:MAG: N-acetylneuraminate synthase family protein [Dehalococcoidales bacterium]|nr:N-acetylneuraminate synthase family protein [Dehalococcoidales bacterium]